MILNDNHVFRIFINKVKYFDKLKRKYNFVFVSKIK